jgi:hypothetical protein
VGTVELWCESRTDERRWRLQIQLRGQGVIASTGTTSTPNAADRVVIEQSEIDAALEAVKVAFGPSTGSEDDGPSRLIKRLEERLDCPRDQWPTSALRALWEPLRDLSDLRFRSARHESRWYNLAGYCLRPGTGFPLDDVRMKALWPMFHQGVRHVKDLQCWAEWWILWRRVAAGLARPHHEELSRRLLPFLLPGKQGSPVKKGGRPKPEPHEMAEIWRTAASLERLAPDLKVALGQVLMKELSKPTLANHVLWCLGRLGARMPLYGPANTTVPKETAEPWATILVERAFAPGRETADAIFALSQIARVSGDRARDLDPDLRLRVIDRLRALAADAETIRSVIEYQEREAVEQGQALGDSLPAGLRLVSNP